MTFSERSKSDLLILELMPRLQVVVQPGRTDTNPAASVDGAIRSALLGEQTPGERTKGVYVFHNGKLAGRPAMATVDPPARVPGRLQPVDNRRRATCRDTVRWTRSFPPTLGDQS